MSEFVECQNCGRKFFAENIECPYCRDEQSEWEREQERGHHDVGGIHRVLFAGLGLVLLLIAGLALASLRQVPFGPGWLLPGSEASLALATAIGLWMRRRWARWLAIGFILGNAALALAGMLEPNRLRGLAWGPGPLALVLFLVPLFSPQARERYRR